MMANTAATNNTMETPNNTNKKSTLNYAIIALITVMLCHVTLVLTMKPVQLKYSPEELTETTANLINTLKETQQRHRQLLDNVNELDKRLEEETQLILNKVANTRRPHAQTYKNHAQLLKKIEEAKSKLAERETNGVTVAEVEAKFAKVEMAEVEFFDLVTEQPRADLKNLAKKLSANLANLVPEPTTYKCDPYNSAQVLEMLGAIGETHTDTCSSSPSRSLKAMLNSQMLNKLAGNLDLMSDAIGGYSSVLDGLVDAVVGDVSLGEALWSSLDRVQVDEKVRRRFAGFAAARGLYGASC